MSSFQISNYKNLDSILLDNLKNINLLVGDNNAGKTNILEALMLYASQFNLETIQNILGIRGEDVSMFSSNQASNSLNTLLPLVYNYDGKILQSSGITLSTTNRKVSLKIMYRIISQTATNKTAVTLLPIGSAIKLPPYQKVMSREVVLVAERSTTNYVLMSLQQSLLTQLIIPPTHITEYQYVHCPSKRTNNLDVLWGNITMTPMEKYVLDALKVIEPQITNFNIIKDKNNRTIPKVSISNQSPIPIYSMGDGICHILNIILALLNVQDGILLLDEVDSGLHFNKHKELWKILIHLSNALNIQIFATTHNQDCMRALAEVSDEIYKNTNLEQSTFYFINRDASGALVSNPKTNYTGIIDRIIATPENVK